MKEKKNKMQFFISLGSICLFLLCFSVLNFKNASLSQPKKVEKQDSNALSMPLDIHVDLTSDDKMESSASIKLSRIKDEKKEYAIFNQNETGYDIVAWTTSEQDATNVRTDELGNVRLNNMLEGEYVVYQYETTSDMFKPVSISIVKKNENQLMAFSNVDGAIKSDLDSDTVLLALAQKEERSYYGYSCQSSMSSLLCISKAVWPPSDEEWNYDFNLHYDYYIDNDIKETFDDEFVLSKDSNFNKFYSNYRRGKFKFQLEETSIDDQYSVHYSGVSDGIQNENQYSGTCGENCYIEVINWKKGTGDLIVSKHLAGEYCEKYIPGSYTNICTKQVEFTITVKLTPAEGVTLQDEYPYYFADEDVSVLPSRYVDASSLNLETVGNSKVGTIHLKKGEAIRIVGLPSGTSYETIENDIDLEKYVVLEDNTSGVIPDADAAVATFTNVENNDQYAANIKVQKIWEDDNNQYKIRPTSVTIYLKDSNGKVVGSKVATEKNDWSVSFIVPKYDDYGGLIHYTADEEPIEGYDKKVEDDMVMFTNIFQSTDKSLEVTLKSFDGSPFTSQTRNSDWKDVLILASMSILLVMGFALRNKYIA